MIMMPAPLMAETLAHTSHRWAVPGSVTPPADNRDRMRIKRSPAMSAAPAAKVASVNSILGAHRLPPSNKALPTGTGSHTHRWLIRGSSLLHDDTGGTERPGRRRHLDDRWAPLG